VPSTKDRPVTFAARRSNQRVTIIPGDHKFAGGRIIGEEPGQHVEFVNGTFTTTDPDVIEHLRRRIAAPDAPAIWEVPVSAPASTEVLVELATANAERTREILDDERAGWERPDVIAACEAKLAQFGTRGPKPKID
jgi:hypothetical protein